MSAAIIKTVLRWISIVWALLGVLLLVYVGLVVAGARTESFSAIDPFVTFYGGYLIFLAIFFKRRFSSRFVHEFISAIMCPIIIVVCVGIMNSGFSTTLIRAIITIFTFLFIGVIYKILLGYLGRKLFGKEIIE
ncbi:MAG TPA: hypothetical protein VGH42_14005 [Verrucomicrobiae bacterium]|jgi:hypothetical protein